MKTHSSDPANTLEEISKVVKVGSEYVEGAIARRSDISEYLEIPCLRIPEKPGHSEKRILYRLN